MNKHLVERLKKVYELTFENHNCKGYNKVVAMLDDIDRKYWPIIGWDNPKKRWFDHHYLIRQSGLLHFLRCMKHHLTKRIN